MINRSPKQVRAAMTLGTNLMLAPMVVAMRLPLMLAETRPDAIGAETLRAVNEKSKAMADGMLAAQMSYWRSAMQFWPEVLAGKTPSLFDGLAAERSMQAALRPAGRRVKANYRRLSKPS